MTDREKVMQWLKICANGCKDGCPYEYKNLVYRVECKADLMSDALELLKEQEAVVPLCRWHMMFCGSCLYAIPKTVNYCPQCGRKVKWVE